MNHDRRVFPHIPARKAGQSPLEDQGKYRWRNLPAADFGVVLGGILDRAATSTTIETTPFGGDAGPVPARPSDPANDCACGVGIRDGCLDCRLGIGS